MQFNGTFELEDVTREEAWLALSDPVMIKNVLPGCQFLMEVESDGVNFDELREQANEDGGDPPTLPEAAPEEVAERTFEEGELYAAVVELGVGSIKPSFETLVTITNREFPEMEADGEGSASNSSFEMTSGMSLSETDDGVAVEWQAEADVFGRIAQMGQRVINPVANKVVNRFFDQIADRLRDVGEEESSGFREKIRNFV